MLSHDSRRKVYAKFCGLTDDNLMGLHFFDANFGSDFDGEFKGKLDDHKSFDDIKDCVIALLMTYKVYDKSLIYGGVKDNDINPEFTGLLARIKSTFDTKPNITDFDDDQKKFFDKMWNSKEKFAYCLPFVDPVAQIFVNYNVQTKEDFKNNLKTLEKKLKYFTKNSILTYNQNATSRMKSRESIYNNLWNLRDDDGNYIVEQEYNDRADEIDEPDKKMAYKIKILEKNYPDLVKMARDIIVNEYGENIYQFGGEVSNYKYDSDSTSRKLETFFNSDFHLNSNIDITKQPTSFLINAKFMQLYMAGQSKKSKQPTKLNDLTFFQDKPKDTRKQDVYRNKDGDLTNSEDDKKVESKGECAALGMDSNTDCGSLMLCLNSGKPELVAQCLSNSKYENAFKKAGKDIKEKLNGKIIVGHLAPYVLEKNQVEIIIILRRNPYELLLLT